MKTRSEVIIFLICGEENSQRMIWINKYRRNLVDIERNVTFLFYIKK